MLVNPGHSGGRQVQHRASVLGNESLISIAEAVNFADAIALVQLPHQAYKFSRIRRTYLVKRAAFSDFWHLLEES